MGVTPMSEPIIQLWIGALNAISQPLLSFWIGVALATAAAFSVKPLMRSRLTRRALQRLEELVPARGPLLDVGCYTGVFLDVASARGWAVAPGEMIEGINTLAAPVFSHEGRMVASIAIVGSTKYVPVSPPAEQVEAVVSAARRTSETMGWRPALSR